MGLGNYTLCNQTWGCGNGIRPACYAGDAERRLRVRVPLPTPYAPVAQLVERRIEVPRVRGSSPLWGAKRRIGRAGRLRRFRKPLSPQGLQRFKSSILRHTQRCANGYAARLESGWGCKALGGSSPPRCARKQTLRKKEWSPNRTRPATPDAIR